MRIQLPNDINSDVVDFVQSFVNHPALVELVRSFGGSYPSDDILTNLDYLVQFSDIWDYRSRATARTEHNENARWLLGAGDFSDVQIRCLELAKYELRLVDNRTPNRESYDYVWVLGGGRLACLLRTRLAKEVCDELHLQPKKISMLGSSRPINESERCATDTYAPGASTEFDLFVAAHDKVFAECSSRTQQSDQRNANASWRIQEYDDGMSILSAPSLDPDNRRANSLDTYLFFMQQYDVQPGSSILLVTSAIYVPYQHLEAFRSVAVENHVGIDTIGYPASWAGQMRGIGMNENYLQEIRSTIQSLSRLVNSPWYKQQS